VVVLSDARAPNYELAYEDYHKGMKYKEIAEKYGVTINTVKSWKTRYKWSKGAKKGVHTKSEKVCTQKGGQPGNQNAVGHGGTGPPGNKNAVKTGEFETLFFDVLEDHEKQLAGSVPADKERLLLQEIQLFTVREHRMLKRIEELKQSPAADLDKAAGMTAVKYKSGTEKDKWTDLTEYTGILGQIQSIEEALTRVQGRKQKAIDSLHRYGYDDAKLEIELMRLEIVALKSGSQEAETENDGFLEAMGTEVSDIWGDADEY